MKIEEKAEQYYKLRGGYELASWSSDDNVFDDTVLISFAADFAEKMMHDLVDRYEEKIQSKVPELRELANK